MTLPSVPTCLFTGDALPPDTREEHTIQRGLGGRIRSREVSSNAFNQRCGGLIDRFITEVYADTMAVLGPCLPVESRGGDRRIDLAGQPGRYVIDNQGQQTLRGAAVVGRDPVTNRPTAVLGTDEISLRRIIDQNIQSGATERRQVELPPVQEGLFPQRAMLSAEIEIAALKAALLTFDHVLRDDPGRFTRNEALEETRLAVRRMVMEELPVDAGQMTRMVLGLQYDQDYLDLYERLRSMAPHQSTPFEHVVFASGNPATRALDVVFWAFRQEAFAFRVSSNWRGDGFTYVAVNGILRETAFSQAYRLPCSQLLGRPNMRRSHLRVTRHPTADERQAIHQEIFENRAALYRRAVAHIEYNCDDIVRENLERYARLNTSGDHSLSAAVRQRLLLLFGRRLDTQRTQFEAVINGLLAPAPTDQIPADQVLANSPNWEFWLNLYRQCLDHLRESVGLPGEIFVVGRAEVESGDGERLLGQWPDP